MINKILSTWTKREKVLLVSSVSLFLSYFFLDFLFENLFVLGFLAFVISGITCFVFLILTILEGKLKWIPIGICLVLSIAITELFESELFKSKIVLHAFLKSDLSSIDLKLRENNIFEVVSSSLFSSEIFKGKYSLVGDKIVFHERHFENNFIPDTLTIIGDKIVFKFDKEGKPLIDDYSCLSIVKR